MIVKIELSRNIGRAIVFIQLGVSIIAKQANRWVITGGL